MFQIQVEILMEKQWFNQTFDEVVETLKSDVKGSGGEKFIRIYMENEN